MDGNTILTHCIVILLVAQISQACKLLTPSESTLKSTLRNWMLQETLHESFYMVPNYSSTINDTISGDNNATIYTSLMDNPSRSLCSSKLIQENDLSVYPHQFPMAYLESSTGCNALEGDMFCRPVIYRARVLRKDMNQRCGTKTRRHNRYAIYRPSWKTIVAAFVCTERGQSESN